MAGTYETKKYSIDKIALLALLALTLLIAHLITVHRSAITLSEPIILDYAGLSVSMPVSGGWKGEKKWKYHDNNFSISSFFIPYPPTPTALAHCKYLLAPQTENLETRFEQKAAAIEGKIAKTGSFAAGALDINWVHIKKEKSLLNIFFGTALLPDNRQLDIEVHQTTGDADLAERTFKNIAENLKFQDNHLLKAGCEIIAYIKNKGIDSFLNNQCREDFFIIKDGRKQTVGFSTEILVSAPQKTQLNIQAASFYYLRGRYATEQITLLKTNNRFDEFVWKSETSSSIRKIGIELILDKTGTMSVKNFNVNATDKQYPLSPAAVPELLLDFVFSQMLRSNTEKIVVDIIESDGTITPVLISKTDDNEAQYALKLLLLDTSGSSEKICLDTQMQISKIMLQKNGAYLFERTTKENIISLFPERAPYFLQKNYLLQQDAPQD